MFEKKLQDFIILIY